MKKALRILVPLLLAVFILASIVWYLFVYDRPFARDMLLGQARYQSDKGNTQLSSWFYDLAYEHSGQDKNVAIELANQYKADGNYTKAEYTLSHAIADGPTLELYTVLCQVYVEQDKLLDAVNMLDKIADPAMKAQLDAARPAAPAPDYAPGFYSAYISVALETDNGSTYYTVTHEDGQTRFTQYEGYPSTSDPLYSEPITLEMGETTIQAITVAPNGLVSPLTTAGYTVGGVIELVEFQDPAVEAAVRSLLGMDADEPLYTNQLWEITEFTYPADGTFFSDLYYLPHLQTLTVEEKTLDSLSGLSSLSDLETLTLINCEFPAEDLSYLAILPSLQKLTMEGCGLSTIANLANAQGLTYLDLSRNTLRNLEPLSNMNTLQELYLDHNAVTTLNALSGLSYLEILDISYNSVASISPIATCNSLRELIAGNNSLEALDAIENLTALTTLTVDHNSLTDVSVLSNCTGLTQLNIANNQISDISPLSSLMALEIFDFSYNSVEELPQWEAGGALRTIDGSHNKLENIDVLQTMEELSYVYMDYNEIKSIDSIATCFHLVLVNVYGNPIKDVSALTEHNIIVNYDPT